MNKVSEFSNSTPPWNHRGREIESRVLLWDEVRGQMLSIQSLVSPGPLVEMRADEPTTREKMRARTSHQRLAKKGCDNWAVVVEAKRKCGNQEPDATPKALIDSPPASWKLVRSWRKEERGSRLRNP